MLHLTSTVEELAQKKNFYDIGYYFTFMLLMNFFLNGLCSCMIEEIYNCHCCVEETICAILKFKVESTIESFLDCFLYQMLPCQPTWTHIPIWGHRSPELVR